MDVPEIDVPRQVPPRLVEEEHHPEEGRLGPDEQGHRLLEIVRLSQARIRVGEMEFVEQEKTPFPPRRLIEFCHCQRPELTGNGFVKPVGFPQDKFIPLFEEIPQPPGNSAGAGSSRVSRSAAAAAPRASRPCRTSRGSPLPGRR